MPFEDRVGRILDYVTRSDGRLLLLDDRAGPVGGGIQQLIGARSVRNLLIQTRSRRHLAGRNDVRRVATSAAGRLLIAARWRCIAG